MPPYGGRRQSRALWARILYYMDILSSKKLIFLILIWVFIFIPSVILYSSKVAKYFYATDFPVYYITAKRVVDPNITISDIYKFEVKNSGLPEKNSIGQHFIYSPVIATLLSPLSLMSYYTAKTTFIFLNIMSYFASIALILKLIDRYKGTFFLQALLFMLIPFLTNTWGAQLNGLILLIIIAGIYLAEIKKYGLSGTFLGFSALFKISPLIITLFLGFFNRRLTAASLILFSLAILAPGTFQWLKTIPMVSAGHTPVYLFLNQYGFKWMLLYSSLVALMSFYCLLKSKTSELMTIFAYSIPSTFAIMPVVTYHHLIILVVTYIVIFHSKSVFSVSYTLKYFLLFASLHINSQFIWKFLPNPYWSVLLIWVTMSWILFTRQDFQKNSILNIEEKES
jgi:hypothetical protein